MPEIPVPIKVVPQTDKHLNFKTLWAGLRGLGMMILGANMYLLDHPDILAFGVKKWIWLGPLVAGIGAFAESASAQKAKQTRQEVDKTPVGGIQEVPEA